MVGILPADINKLDISIALAAIFIVIQDFNHEIHNEQVTLVTSLQVHSVLNQLVVDLNIYQNIHTLVHHQVI